MKFDMTNRMKMGSFRREKSIISLKAAADSALTFMQPQILDFGS